jgi:hypothetical protein
MLDQLRLLETLAGAPLILIVLAACILVWRWLVHQDRKIDEERSRRYEAAALQMDEIEQDLRQLGDKVGHCATQAELRRVELELGKLQSDVRADLAQVRGALEVLATRVAGQGDILTRIDDHLRKRDAT